MSYPEEQVRLWVEDQIDTFIENPDFWVNAFTEYLSKAGIRPDIETVLSMMVGITYGCVATNTKAEFDRAMTGEENDMVKNLIQRRALELRTHYELEKFR